MQPIVIGQVWQHVNTQYQVIVKDVENKIVVVEDLTDQSIFYDTVFNFVAEHKLIKESYFSATSH
ncbi:MAG: hypothetical protein WAQ98_01755 [Blastocatellia bacterium]